VWGLINSLYEGTHKGMQWKGMRNENVRYVFAVLQFSKRKSRILTPTWGKDIGDVLQQLLELNSLVIYSSLKLVFQAFCWTHAKCLSLYLDRFTTIQRFMIILHLSRLLRKNLNLVSKLVGYLLLSLQMFLSWCLVVMTILSKHSATISSELLELLWHPHRAFVDYLSHMIQIWNEYFLGVATLAKLIVKKHIVLY